MNENPSRITWTKDCAMSCFLFRIYPEEMLVCFLQNVEYHAYLNGTDDVITATACNYVKKYVKTRVKNSVKSSCTLATLQNEYSGKEKYTRVKCLKLLKTVLSDVSISVAEQTERLNAAILQCKDIIVQRHQYEEKISLRPYEILLPANFIVTCFINKISPYHLIADLFKNIDYVGYLASSPDNKPGINPAIDFFFLFAAQYGDMPATLTDEDGNYYQQHMESIASRFQADMDVQNRREALMEVASEWFWAAERFTIRRTEFATSLKIVRMSACRFKKIKRRWRL